MIDAHTIVAVALGGAWGGLIAHYAKELVRWQSARRTK